MRNRQVADRSVSRIRLFGKRDLGSLHAGKQQSRCRSGSWLWPRYLAMLVLAPLLGGCGPSTQDGVRLYAEGQFQQAREVFLVKAVHNDPIANYFLAQMYERGEGVEADLDKAVNQYMAAATRGLPQGQAALAALQATAAEGPALAERLQALQTLASQHPEAGLPRLCETLLYLAGKSLTKKTPDAETPAAAATETGYGSDFLACAENLQAYDEVTALRLLASAHVSGALGSKAFDQGANYAEQAANQGDIAAHAMLAAAYAEGLGKPQDFQRAYAHANTALTLSAGQISSGRRNELERLQKRAFRNLSQADQQAATKLAAQLKENTGDQHRRWELEHRFGWAMQAVAN